MKLRNKLIPMAVAMLLFIGACGSEDVDEAGNPEGAIPGEGAIAQQDEMQSPEEESSPGQADTVSGGETNDAQEEPDGDSAGGVDDTTQSGSAGNSGAINTSSTANTWNADAVITFNGTAIDVSGKGAEATGRTVTISSAGIYVLSGTLSSGQVIVNAASTDKVTLILDGVDITAEKNVAIYAVQCDDLTITLAEDSVNTLRDAASFSYADTANKEPDATLFSKDDLNLNGKGTLNITANYNNAIGTKDDLVISAGVYNITAANHGIRGRDSVTISGGSISITAGNDGIQSNNDEDGAKGFITLSGGAFTIASGHDGIQAETTLTISGGTYNITSGGGAGASGLLATESYKGIKSVGNMMISGGVFTMDCADDTIHSNGNITIIGGSMQLSSGDDGIHSDADLLISGGIIDITKSYEGIEGFTITVSGGVVNIIASDDGVNVAGGNDTNTGFFGGDNFSGGANSDRLLTVTGGMITINAQGDGIDVNGNATVSGGEIYVSGPTNSGNGALDYDGSFNINGGTFIAAGASGMAQAPGDSSRQPVIMLYFTSGKAAGSTVTVQDASGVTVLEYSPEKDFQCIALSCEEMKSGGVYTLLYNGAKLTTVTAVEGVTAISETGEEMTVGGGGWGGRPGGGVAPDGGNAPGGGRN